MRAAFTTLSRSFTLPDRLLKPPSTLLPPPVLLSTLRLRLASATSRRLACSPCTASITRLHMAALTPSSLSSLATAGAAAPAPALLLLLPPSPPLSAAMRSSHSASSPSYLASRKATLGMEGMAATSPASRLSRPLSTSSSL